MADPDKEMVTKIHDALEKRQKEVTKKRVCRFDGCDSTNLRALTDNGIIGPGYRVSNWVCYHCGRVQ